MFSNYQTRRGNSEKTILPPIQLIPLIFKEVFSHSGRCRVRLGQDQNQGGDFIWQETIGSISVMVKIFYPTNIRIQVDDTILYKIKNSCGIFQETNIRVLADWYDGTNVLSDVT